MLNVHCSPRLAGSTKLGSDSLALPPALADGKLFSKAEVERMTPAERLWLSKNLELVDLVDVDMHYIQSLILPEGKQGGYWALFFLFGSQVFSIFFVFHFFIFIFIFIFFFLNHSSCC